MSVERTFLYVSVGHSTSDVAVRACMRVYVCARVCACLRACAARARVRRVNACARVCARAYLPVCVPSIHK